MNRSNASRRPYIAVNLAAMTIGDLGIVVGLYHHIGGNWSAYFASLPTGGIARAYHMIEMGQTTDLS